MRIPWRRRTALYAVALICCSGAVAAMPAAASAAPAPEPRPAAAAATFTDDFDGPAGAA
ncbi:1,3-beta-glucanase, partial [Streptomyces sp. AcH 505]